MFSLLLPSDVTQLRIAVSPCQYGVLPEDKWMKPCT